jgi:hypothetical protein
VALLREQPTFSSEIVERPEYFMLPCVEEVTGALKLILVVHPNVLRYVDISLLAEMNG